MALAEKEGLVSDVPELARTFCRAKFLLNSFRRTNIGLLFWDGVASLPLTAVFFRGQEDWHS